MKIWRNPSMKRKRVDYTMRRELSLYAQLSEIVPKPKAYWILWKYGLYSGTFEELSKNFLNGLAEEKTKDYIYQEDVQEAIKKLLKIMHQEKMIKLYETYYEKALNGDVNSAKFLMDFSKDFFKDSKDELLRIVNGMDIDGDE